MTFTVSATTVALIMSAIMALAIGCWAYAVCSGERYVKRSDFLWMTSFAAAFLVLANILFFALATGPEYSEDRDTGFAQTTAEAHTEPDDITR